MACRFSSNSLPVDRRREGAGARGHSGLARARSGDLLALALGRGLEVAAFGLDSRDRTTVEIVDVTPELQLAGVVDEGRLIGQVDPDRRRLELQVLLATAVHALHPGRRPVLLRAGDVEENLGVFGRILHAHAAVAVSADLVREVVLVRRVVLVDRGAVAEV